MIEHETNGFITAPLARTIGSKTGIVKDLHYSPPPQEDPLGGFVASGNYPYFNSSEDIDMDEIGALGNGYSAKQSVTTFLGEVIERYQLLITKPKTIRTNYETLSRSHTMVDPEYLSFYSDSERERAREAGLIMDQFNESIDRSWVAGVDLTSGEKSYLPSELVTWSELDEDENPIFYKTTNGLACHESTPKALLSSIYEYLERHAFLETWFAGKVPDRVVTDEYTTENEFVNLQLLEYNTDIDIDIPMLGCVVRQKEQPSHNLGWYGGAASTYCSAIEESLLETAQFLKAFADYDFNKQLDRSPDEIIDLDKNMVYYSDPNNAELIEERLTGDVKNYEVESQEPNFDSASEELQYVLEQLRSINVTPIAFDLTSQNISETGLVVTRVIIPELLPLCPPSFPPDAHPRLADRIEVTDPHPYP